MSINKMTEFFGGCASGVVQSLIGHPFDTIKVLLQTNKPFYRNPFHYYKGVSFPTTFSILSTGITFDIQSKFFNKTQSHVIAGFGSGGIVSPLIYYFDVGKIHYQTRPGISLSLKHFKGTYGMVATFLRESISTSVYMGVYFSMEERNGPLFSGGSAGLASWASTYPIDVVKTRQMSKRDTNLSFVKAWKMGNLWKGFSVCALRAVLVNAAGFWSYNKVKNSTFLTSAKK